MIVIVAMIASMFPFFNRGIRVLDVTSTNSAFPCLPRIFSVIALAISISKPSTLLLLMSIIPNNRVSYFTPQTIVSVFLLRSNMFSFATLFPLQPVNTRNMSPKRKNKRIIDFLRILFLLLMIND